MRFFRMPFIAGWLYPDALFRFKTEEKILCLTFDDGPDPESTPELLDILEKYNIRALFFCDGKAAELYPLLVKKIIEKGHLVGNHGYNHLNGWTTSAKEYYDDVVQASKFTSAKIFRPPYGLLRPGQYIRLRKSFRIIFWDLMPFDFDRNMDAGKSLEILNNYIRPGSIIVLHDRQDSTALTFLDEFLEMSLREGYTFSCPELQ
jgi:peptidoglycan/xylan/chitin deacetylase (PgdA/CDA1 family)